jgi:hypothetical protein
VDLKSVKTERSVVAEGEECMKLVIIPETPYMYSV